MWKYVKNTKNKWKYVENMKKYEALGPRRAKHRAKQGTSRHIRLSQALGLEKILSSPHIDSET